MEVKRWKISWERKSKMAVSSPLTIGRVPARPLKLPTHPILE